MLTGNPGGLVERAFYYAKQAHESVGQRRKYTGEPYIVHPVAVAGVVATVPHTDAMLAAALLHDTKTDTGTTEEDLKREFGEEVSDLVGWLSEVSLPTDGNRAARKAIDLLHFSRAPAQAKTIKLADVIDNSKDIVTRDPVFARIYLPEKAAEVEALRGGDGRLWQQAYDLVQQGLKALQG